MDEIESKVIEIVAECLRIEKSNVTLQSRPVEDLGADSLDLIEIVMAIEVEFGIETNDEEVSKISVVSDIVSLVKSKKAQSPAQGS